MLQNQNTMKLKIIRKFSRNSFEMNKNNYFGFLIILIIVNLHLKQLVYINICISKMLQKKK